MAFVPRDRFASAQLRKSAALLLMWINGVRRTSVSARWRQHGGREGDREAGRFAQWGRIAVWKWKARLGGDEPGFQRCTPLVLPRGKLRRVPELPENVR